MPPIDFKNISSLIRQSRNPMIVIMVLLVSIGIIQSIVRPAIYEAKGIISIPTIKGALFSSPDDMVERLSSAIFIEKICAEMEIPLNTKDGQSIRAGLINASVGSRNKVFIKIITEHENRAKPILEGVIGAIDKITKNESKVLEDDLEIILNQNTKILSIVDLNIEYINKLGAKQLNPQVHTQPQYILSNLLQERRNYSNEIAALKQQFRILRSGAITSIEISNEKVTPSLMQNLIKFFMLALCGILLGIFWTLGKRLYKTF